MSREVDVRDHSGNSREKTLLKMRDAKEKEVTRIMTNVARQKLCLGRLFGQSCGIAHLESPTFALVGGASESGNVGRRGLLGWVELKLISFLSLTLFTSCTFSFPRIN